MTRCRTCGSPDHLHHHDAGPICPAGYRADYEPGKHDPQTGEAVTLPLDK